MRVDQNGSVVEAEVILHYRSLKNSHGLSMFSCQVTKVDGALAGVTFPDAEETLEWIYRGSMRFEPLAKSMGVKFERGVVRKEGHRRPLPTMNCPKPRPFTPHLCSPACLIVKPSKSLPPPLNPLYLPLLPEGHALECGAWLSLQVFITRAISHRRDGQITTNQLHHRPPPTLSSVRETSYEESPDDSE